MKILFASQNLGKQNEAKALFKDLSVELVFPNQIKSLEGFDPEETGETFEANALLKARAYAEQSGLPSIADDSGIEIDGMGGLPGVHSNRWFQGTADERNEEVLKRLSQNDESGNQKPRTARYITVACFYDPETEEYALYKATQEGSIAQTQYEGEGFDYDKIFIPQGQTETFSVLGNDFKNQDSQRARAYKMLHEYLKNILNDDQINS